MKFLLMLLVLLFAVWLWRSGRQAKQVPRQRASPASQAPLDMIACERCGLHLPKVDAVVGKNGLYCSVEHRQRAEP
jgi:uncharacterized protein